MVIVRKAAFLCFSHTHWTYWTQRRCLYPHLVFAQLYLLDLYLRVQICQICSYISDKLTLVWILCGVSCGDDWSWLASEYQYYVYYTLIIIILLRILFTAVGHWKDKWVEMGPRWASPFSGLPLLGVNGTDQYVFLWSMAEINMFFLWSMAEGRMVSS